MTLFADSGCQAASSYICAVALCVWSLRLVSAFKMNFYSLDLFWIVAADRYGFCCHIVPNSVLQQERIGKQMDACQCHGFLNYDLSTELNRRFTWLTHKTLFVDSKCHARQLLIIGAEPDSQTVSLSDTFCIQDESSVFYMSRPSADIVAVIWLDFSQSDWTHFDPSQTQATLLMQSYGCATLCFWVFGVDGSLWCQRWRGDGSVAPLWFCSW